MMTQDPVYSGGMKEPHILCAHNTITLSETRDAYHMGKSVLHPNGLKPMAFGIGQCYTSGYEKEKYQEGNCRRVSEDQKYLPCELPQ
jgi:hypothetical protein